MPKDLDNTLSMFYKKQSIRDIVSFLEKIRDRLDWVPKHLETDLKKHAKIQ